MKPSTPYRAGLPSDWWLRWGKRTFDLVAASISVVIWGPLLAVVFVLVWLSNGRPLLFRQLRVGWNGKPFTILKVRTMQLASGPPPPGLLPERTCRGDPRITRIGRWLRRWRLDELPQMICVIRGDMSLVGPRPEMLAVAATLADMFPGYGLRHLATPGLTGLCQVSSSYQAFDSIDGLRARLADDLTYVERRCILLDMQILLRTVHVLARGTGAT